MLTLYSPPTLSFFFFFNDTATTEIYTLSLHDALPIFKGVIAHAKANPGKLNFGSPGVGTTQHFSAELLRQLAGLDMTHIPYRSEEHTSELQSQSNLVCRLLLEKKTTSITTTPRLCSTI